MAVEKSGFQDYDVYQQDHKFVSVGGTVQLPVASRTAATRLIRLHGGMGKRIVTFRADRHGRPPVIPKPIDLSADTLLSHSVTPMLPRPNEQAGGYDWSVTGEYEYAQNTLREPGTDNLPTGTYPFALPVQTLVAGVLNDSVSNPDPITVSNAVVDFTTGGYIWPFTDFPPIFFSGELLT